MFKSLSNSLTSKLLIVVMLLAFIGQAMAYATMPCQKMLLAKGSAHQTMMMHHEMSANQQSMTHDHQHANMDHAMSAMTEHSDVTHSAFVNTDNSDDCCDQNCTCPNNLCTFAWFLPIDNHATVSIKQILHVAHYVSAQPLTNISSLFRPPIIA